MLERIKIELGESVSELCMESWDSRENRLLPDSRILVGTFCLSLIYGKQETVFGVLGHQIRKSVSHWSESKIILSDGWPVGQVL